MLALMNESPGYESLMIKYDLNDSQDLNIEWTKVSCGFFFYASVICEWYFVLSITTTALLGRDGNTLVDHQYSKCSEFISLW